MGRPGVILVPVKGSKLVRTMGRREGLRGKERDKDQTT